MYGACISFFTFLRSAVNELSYWGGRKKQAHKQHRMTRLSPLNQFYDSCKTEAEFAST